MRDTKSDHDSRPAAPNFTSACVVMFGVNLTWILFAIWAVWGLIAAAGLGWAVNLLIRRIEATRG
ncbi:MAG: hypothetical protein AAF744_12450 [Pseudomonadota bacterium]